MPVPYLIALVAIVVFVIGLWRLLGPTRSAVGGFSRAPRRTSVPPDDNPDFLRDLDRRARPED